MFAITLDRGAVLVGCVAVGFGLGYARLAGSRLLDHAVRRAVLDAVSREPGARVAWLAANLGVSRGNVRHHVAALSRAGLVRVVSDGVQARVFSPGGRPLEAEALAGVSGSAARLVAAARMAGGELDRAAWHVLAADLPRRTRNHAWRLLASHPLVEADATTLRIAAGAGGQSLAGESLASSSDALLRLDGAGERFE